MLLAQRTRKDDQPATRNINMGVTVWNLHHPLTSIVAHDWKNACRTGIAQQRYPSQDEGYYLQQVLHSKDRIASISTVWDEFLHQDGTVIKSFQSSNDGSWDRTEQKNNQQQQEEEEWIQRVTQEICDHYLIDKDALDQRNYTNPSNVSRNQSSCVPRRKSLWHLHSAPKNTIRPSHKRLLIAQYSSFGSYASLLEETAPLNKAYARKWNHDMLIVQGTALVLRGDRKDCPLPEERSTFNKIPILMYALSHTDVYDQLLLLDADALISNMGFDITTVLNDDEMLAAQRVDREDTRRTWNINNGITLWNLKHNMTKRISATWLQKATIALDGVREFGWSHNGDQHYLHLSLQSEEGAVQMTNAVLELFRYSRGTAVKHFIRYDHSTWQGSENERRIAYIQESVNITCAQSPLDCKDLEYVRYTNL